MLDIENFERLNKAKLKGDKKAIQEHSIARIMLRAKDPESLGMGIITSWNDRVSKAENIELFGKLKTELKNLDVGYNVLNCHWKIRKDPTVMIHNCPPEQLVDHVEPYLFVVGITQRDILKLQVDYFQEVVVYSGPETAGSVCLLLKDGSSVDLGHFDNHSIQESFSGFKPKHTSKIDYIEWPVQSQLEKLHMLEHRVGVKLTPRN